MNKFSKTFSSAKKLFVFDFDETIINENSDTYIYKALKTNEIPTEFKNPDYTNINWVDFMKKVFLYMKKENVAPKELKLVLENVPLTPGFDKLLNYLVKKQDSIESIIISNANNLFIEWILSKRGYDKLFRKIYTNPAFINDGMINISYYHSHNCEICPINMCKKEILLKHIRENQNKEIFFACDGLNDYCATTALKNQDILFCRKNYTLYNYIQKNQSINQIQGKKIHFWENGFEILEEIEKICD